MEPETDNTLLRGHRFRALPTVALTAAIAGILLCAAAVAFLANNVQREVDALAVATSDTTQWTLVQTEVELMALMVALHEAEHDEAPNLEEVRRRYDVFYSRVKLIENSRQFADLRELPEASRSIAALNGFLDRHTATMDGPLDGLVAALPIILDDLGRLRSTARGLALLGVSYYSEDSDFKRARVAWTLSSIGYLTLALVLALFTGIAVLMALYRRSIRSERAAADARSRLEEVIATSLDAIIVADAAGRITEYNGAAERVFGHSRAEALAQDLSGLILPDDQRASPVVGLRDIHEPGGPQGSALRRLEARRKDGSIFPVELALTSACHGGEVIFVAFLRDISDRVAAEQELIQARDRAVAGERAKAALLAVMSHEMRTPLNGILGTIELLEATRLTARQKTFIAAMKTSAGLLLQHVNGVLSMARSDSGELELEAVEVDPAALLQELVESQRHAIEANGNRIGCGVSAAPPRICADPLRLRQVILNLIANANKFTRNGEILVECDSIPDLHQVEFRVIDSGIGIAEGDRERIFDAFRTLDSSYGRQVEGTGLGLAISRRLVQAMGGEIGVESEPGEGSLFWVRLPLGPPGCRVEAVQRIPEGSEAATRAPAGSFRVLLVEDNPINRLVAREMLEIAGHRVTEAHGGHEGVRQAGTHRFDVILMDISMPDLDGLAVTRAIRGTHGPNRTTPIIALTAHALPEDTQRFQAAGIVATVTKPLSLATLQAALAQAEGTTGAVASPLRDGIADLVARLGVEKASSLLAALVAEAEALIARFDAPDWASTPTEQRADAVHRLGGTASVLGAGRLHAVLQDLEEDYRRADEGAAAHRLEVIGRVWRETQAEVRACLQECEPQADTDPDA